MVPMRLPRGSRRWRLAAAGVAVVALGACELILAERPPPAGQSCPAFRGGCVAVIDTTAEEPMPPLQSEVQAARNIAAADSLQVPRCDTAPWICQLQMSGEVLSEKYFDRNRPR